MVIMRLVPALDALYGKARQANPKRWSGKTRGWSPVGAVTLNPEWGSVVAAVGVSAVAAWLMRQLP